MRIWHEKGIIEVSNKDHKSLSNVKWTIGKFGSHKYAYRLTQRPNRKTIFMHREIMGFPEGMEIDHIDGNGLNNKRSNLRICTSAENKRNRGIDRIRNKSGYKGVFYEKYHKKYRATICVNYKRIYLGYFDTAKDGAIAYNEAVKKYHGKFANLNKII